MPVKIKDLLRMLKDDGWYESRQKGSHKQFKHPYKEGVVTVAFHKLSDDVAPGTLNSILKQSGLKKGDK